MEEEEGDGEGSAKVDRWGQPIGRELDRNVIIRSRPQIWNVSEPFFFGRPRFPDVGGGEGFPGPLCFCFASPDDSVEIERSLPVSSHVMEPRVLFGLSGKVEFWPSFTAGTTHFA